MNKMKSGMVLGVACVACCVGTVIPLVMGGAVGGLAIHLGDEIGVFAAVSLAALGVYVLRKGRRTVRDCACSPDEGCNTGASCTLPAKAE